MGTKELMGQRKCCGIIYHPPIRHIGTGMKWYPETKRENPEGEDKQKICRLLLAVLKETRAGKELEELRYDARNERVIARVAGGVRKINVEGDSGAAMIRDIMTHLGV